MKVYYAHPISLYGTKQEQRDIETLKALGLEIINPSDDEKQKLYQEKGIEAFRQFVDGADCIAFRAFHDGSIGAGVAQEIKWAEGKPVIELPVGLTRRTLSVEATREILKESGHR